MRSDCLRCRSRLSPFVTLWKRICRVLAPVATARELPCSGIVVRSPASPVLNRGCHLAVDWATRNVETLRQDKNSIYVLYRRLIEARRHSLALRRELYRPIPSKGDLLLYVREFGAERMLMALNLGATSATVGRSFGRASRAPYLSRLQASAMVILSTKLFAWMPTRAWSSPLRQRLSFHPLANKSVSSPVGWTAAGIDSGATISANRRDLYDVPAA